jgi:hypothetical protein
MDKGPAKLFRSTNESLGDAPDIFFPRRSGSPDMLRFGTRRTGKVRQTLHYAPNVTRVIVPPLAGMDGVGGWSEIYFSFTPIDDENHLWLITSHVEVTGKDAEAYKAKRAEYERKVAAAPPVMDVVRDIWSGKLRFAEVTHPDLAVVQDIAVQAGQGRIEDRQSERLGRSDAGIFSGERFSRANCAPSPKAVRRRNGRRRRPTSCQHWGFSEFPPSLIL